MKRFIEYMLIAVFSVIMVVAGYQLFQIWEEYHEAGDEYNTLKQFVKEPQNYSDEIPEDDSESEELENIIDFESLKQINPDIVAWLKIEAAGIDYPVVQGEDNEHYLHYTFRGEVNIAGSIFMDYRNNAEFIDGRVILYGHNMRDGSMFAALKDLDIIKEPVAVLYTPEHILRYRLVAEKYVSPSDEIYQIVEKREEKTDKIDICNQLILSTCSSDGSRRLVIEGKLVNYVQDNVIN